VAEPLLRLERLSVAYGDVQVLWDVDLTVDRGEIVALVGANGAGKSTLISTVSGLLAPLSGQVIFDGRSLAGLSTQRIVELGITHVPEGRRLFPAIAVRDQLLLGAFRRSDRHQVGADLDRVLGFFPRLKERLDVAGGKLSGGEQQMVAIGRALMARPRLLMIDELSLGLAPLLVESLMETIGQINREGTTILMVEQDVQTALEQASRGYVLETGHVTLTGPASALLRDPRVREAYLGADVFEVP
jgi:branched-chain amino acid transport system ATP-binding protein